MTDARPAISLGRAKLVLFLSLTSVGIAFSLVFGLLPPLARAAGVGDTEVGTAISIGAVAFVVFAPIWGRISDTWGRTRVIALGFGGQALSYLLLAIVMEAGIAGVIDPTVTFIGMTISRIVFGVLGAGVAVVATAYMADITPPAKRTQAVALVQAGFGLGIALGPALGAALVALGPVLPFWVVVGAIVAAAAASLILLAEPPRHVEPVKKRPSPFDPRFRGFLLCQIAIFAVIAGVQQTIAFYLQDWLGLDVTETSQLVGLGLTTTALAMLGTNLVILRRLNLSPGALIRVGALLIVLGQVVFLWAPVFGWTLVSMAIVGIGFGIAGPAALAGATLAVGAGERGGVTGIMVAGQSMGFAIGPVTAAFVYELANWAPFVGAGALAVGLFAFSYVSRSVRAIGKPVTETPDHVEVPAQDATP